MKNKKLYAILTLVAFMITLMPIMAFAAPGDQPTVGTIDKNGLQLTVGDASDFVWKVTGGTSGSYTVEKVSQTAGNVVVVPVANDIYVANANEAGAQGTTANITTITATHVATYNAAVNNTTISKDASVVATVKANLEVDANAASADQGSIAVSLKQANNLPVAGAVNQDIYVWAESEGSLDQASDALVVGSEVTATSATVTPMGNGIFKINMKAATAEFKIDFQRAGNYVLKGSFDNVTTMAIKDAVKMKMDSEYNKIVVNGTSQKTSDWAMKINDTLITDGNEVDLTSTVISANGVATAKIDVQVLGAEKDAVRNPIANTKVNLDTSSANIELGKKTVTTNYDGKFSIDVTGLREGIYKIYVQAGDFEGTIKVKVGATSASEIEVLKAPKAPIATETAVNDFADFFRFTLSDANGNLVDNNTDAGKATDRTSKYVTFSQAPTANKVKDTDLSIKHVANTEYFTLDTNGNQLTAEGSYEVKIVLDNGRNVKVAFDVKKFDKATNLTIEYPVSTIELGSVTATPDIYFTDNNGVTKTANGSRVEIAANGYAVQKLDETAGHFGAISVKNDEKYLGSKITVTAVAERENLIASTELTVTEEATAIAFGNKNLLLNDNNKVEFKLVDSKGNAIALGSNAVIDDIKVLVTNKSDADAKVSATVTAGTKADLQTKGTGVLSLTSDRETTATVQVVVKATVSTTNNTGLNTKYYTGSEIFSFGKDAAQIENNVTMVTGQKLFVANGKAVMSPVAPFVQDNRTFLPMRALAEALGYDITWDQATQTVTMKTKDVVTTFVLGSSIITVNGEATDMGVKVMAVDEYTVLPVRFAAEAVGYQVDYSTDDKGVTTVTLTK